MKKLVIFLVLAVFSLNLLCIKHDDSLADISVLPVIHRDYWEYSFDNKYDTERWHWVSYPILNTVTDDALIASEFFKDLLQVHKNSYDYYVPTYLEEIQWMVEGNEESIYWINDIFDWSNDVNNHCISSPQGYKIRLQERANLNFPHPLVFTESGFKTPVNTEFPIYGGVENWLGYFKEESQFPEAAFSTIWQDVTMVKGKDWSLIRNPLTGMMTGVSGIINFGDMVIVKRIKVIISDGATPCRFRPAQKALPKDLFLMKNQITFQCISI